VRNKTANSQPRAIGTARGLCSVSGQHVCHTGLPPVPSSPYPSFQPSLVPHLAAQRPMPPLTLPSQPTYSSCRATTGPTSAPSAAPQLRRCLDWSTTVRRPHQISGPCWYGIAGSTDTPTWQRQGAAAHHQSGDARRRRDSHRRMRPHAHPRQPRSTPLFLGRRQVLGTPPYTCQRPHYGRRPHPQPPRWHGR